MSGLSCLIILLAAAYVRCGSLAAISGDASVDGCMMRQLPSISESNRSLVKMTLLKVWRFMDAMKEGILAL